MSRTGVSPLIATLQLALIGVGVPFWAIVRLAGSPLPIRAGDLFLLIAIVGWALLAKAFVERKEAVNSLTAGHGTAIWFAHRLVDESLLGVGILGRQDLSVAPLATSITMPRALQQAELPSELPWAGLGQADDDAEPAPRRTTPTLPAVKPAQPVLSETEEYIVARGATWWSIAEATLGDGRRWSALLELNVGREVAPGRTLIQGDELRIGWSILVPLVASSNEEESNVG